MGLFGRNTNRKHSRIDPATGRNKRDKSPVRGSGMTRRNGRVVERAAQRRAQKTGLPFKSKNSWGW